MRGILPRGDVGSASAADEARNAAKNFMAARPQRPMRRCRAAVDVGGIRFICFVVMLILLGRDNLKVLVFGFTSLLCTILRFLIPPPSFSPPVLRAVLGRLDTYHIVLKILV